MTQPGIALDDIVEIADFSNATMLALAARLEHSAAFQELIAREIKLDGSAVLPRYDDFLNDPVATQMHDSLVP